MPQRNGTGPLDLGTISGRGIGCGMGRRKGFGRGCSAGNGIQASAKELLEGQKAVFEKKITMINNQLNNL